MKSVLRLSVILIFGFVTFISCERPEPTTTTVGPEVATFRALPFELEDVTLLDGPFKEATELNAQSLLNYDPDRFLARFRERAGLEPKAEPYGGWEAQSLAGHSLGHYLSACALMYQTTGDEEFLDRVNYIVEELAICQEAYGDGYVGAFARTALDEEDISSRIDDADAVECGKQVFEEEIANGIIVSAPFSLNGIWAPYYTHHKVLAGLRDAYQLCDNEKALEVKTDFADWLYDIVAHLPDETIQEMLVCEYGGINEVFAELYGMTGEEKYLELSRIFHDEEVLGPLEREIDNLQGYHANTQIPKITGLARRYELTEDETDYNTAKFFWETVVNDHTYVTGGNCNEEYFGEPGKLRDRLGPNTTETCNVYNMLRLTDHLFQWKADAEIAGYYERALLNHIRASQHPEDGRVIYNLNIDMGGRKSFQDPFGFTCCVGTGMENHSKYGKAIYYHNDEELFVNQFIASELNWDKKGVILRQETGFPEDETSHFTIQTEDPVSFTLQIRYPHWVKEGMEIIVNGEAQRISEEPESFVAVQREWNSGDEIEVKFPFSLRLESMPDDESRVAIFNGPIVLAGDLGPEDDPDVYEDPHYVPAMITTDRNPDNWTDPLNEIHRFATTVGKPSDVELEPFYSIYDRRYSIFWDIMTEEQWEEGLRELEREKEAKTELDELSDDKILPGDEALEERANFEGENTHVRHYKGKYGREANRGGWFSYELSIPHDEQTSLILDYWGGFEGSRTFDIVVDNQIIATENISSKKDGHFIKVEYTLPEDVIEGKERINVTFDPHDFNRAGPVFGLRTISTEKWESLEFFN